MADLKNRRHQEDVKNIGEKIAAGGEGREILAAVVPGGGKSRLPGILAEQFPDYQIGWFAPRLSLCHQAAIGMQADFDIEIRESGNEQNPSRGTRGFVSTHASLESQPELWGHAMEHRPTILVVDEFHHMKVSPQQKMSATTKALASIESKAKLVLYMTGTLETNDSSTIYSLQYKPVDGGLVPWPGVSHDYRTEYSRTDALNEDPAAIVPVEFYFNDGPVSWTDLRTGNEVEGVLSKLNREEESAGALTAVSTDIGHSLTQNMLDGLKSDGRKGLVVCADQAQAYQYRKIVRARGFTTYLAVSNEVKAHETIKTFRSRSEQSVLVTVAMAYEGLDERELTHGACLTRYRSKPWIEQMLARLWRVSPGKSECYWWVPDDPPLNRIIESIRNDQLRVIRTKDSGGGGGGGGQFAIPKDSNVDRIRVQSLDESGEYQYKPESEAEKRFREFCEDNGLDVNDPDVQSIMRRVKPKGSRGNGKESVKDKEGKLRNRISNACNELNRAFNLDAGTIQKEVYEANGWRGVSKLTVEELQNVIDTILPNIVARRTRRSNC